MTRALRLMYAFTDNNLADPDLKRVFICYKVIEKKRANEKNIIKLLTVPDALMVLHGFFRHVGKMRRSE